MIKLGTIATCVLLCLILAISCATEPTPANDELQPIGDTETPPLTSEIVEDPSETPSHTPSPTPTPTPSPSSDVVVVVADPMTMENDMGIYIDGIWFPIWQDVTGLLSALGDDFEMFAAPSCVFEGEDKEFMYDGFFVFTNPDGKRDIWYNIYLISDALSTSRDIAVGNTLDEVIAAYGENYFWEGDSIITYSISGIEGDIDSPCIQFTISDNLVIAIEIYFPTNT